MRLTFLGTGTSTGVPQIGCGCSVCRSADPRDRRLRTSALVETDNGRRLLIDCGPDFREQMLRYADFAPLDAVLLTHKHYDHVAGIDDLRPYCSFGPLHLYADRGTADDLRMRLSYCFAESPYPGVPRLELHTVEAGQPFRVAGDETEVVPLHVMHGALPVLGFRIGRLTYITDLSAMPVLTEPLVEGSEVLVVNALRTAPHHSHQSIGEAVALARRFSARDTYFIHMSHHAPAHAAFESALPAGMHVAYDGLKIEF